MINFIGEMPERRSLLALDGLSYHDYGKQPRAGRKLGHCTVVAPTAVARDRLLKAALQRIPTL
jgi:5-(carboxyamino)imidazole ribonucleotide synthase